MQVPTVDKLGAKYFGFDFPSTKELERRTLVTLINTNPAMDYLAPLPENVIPVAGLHIKETKPLPKVNSKEVFDFKITCTDVYFSD